MPGAAFLRSERVTLRTVERDDVETIQRAHNDPGLREGLLYRTPQDRDAVEAGVGRAADGDGTTISLLVCVDSEAQNRSGTEAVGAVDLVDVGRDSAEVSCWLFAEYRDRGYATEAVALVLDYAFDTLGLHHVVGRVVDDNVPGQELVQRLGFSHEGTRREHVYRGGEYHDTYLYGVLAGEWRERRSTG